MYLFDTNIILEIFLNQTAAQDCENALARLDENNLGWISAFSIHAIAAIMGHHKKYRKALHQFLLTLEQDQLLLRYDTSPEEEITVVKWCERGPLDFDDTLQYYIAKTKKWTLITLDKDFNKIKDISILHPRELSVHR